MIVMLSAAKHLLSDWWESFAHRLLHRVERVKLPTGWHYRYTNRLTGQIAYREMPPMSRPGVTFTPEQTALIRDLHANGRVTEAQQIILDILTDDHQ